jgi:hypothetical protein
MSMHKKCEIIGIRDFILILLRLRQETGMKQNNKFDVGEKVKLVISGETVTINKYSYVANMKKYSYTLKEKPRTFYFEEEFSKL